MVSKDNKHRESIGPMSWKSNGSEELFMSALPSKSAGTIPAGGKEWNGQT